MDPQNSDARYTLATVCDKLGSEEEAREHWLAYLRLEPASPGSEYARDRLGADRL